MAVTMSMCDDCNIGNHKACPRHLGEAGCTCQCLPPKPKVATLVQPKRPREEVADLLGIINRGNFFNELMYHTDSIVDEELLTRWEANFLLNIRAQSSSGSGWAPSKQAVYTLRDIKDKLIKKGAI